MRARNPLFLFLSLAVGLALVAFVIHWLLAAPGGTQDPLSGLEIAGAPSVVDGDTTGDAASGDADEAALPDGESTRMSATELPAEIADRNENFALAGARELDVEVRFPAGTPAEENPKVWLFARKGAVDPTERAMLENMDPQDVLRSTGDAEEFEDFLGDDEDHATFWSRRSVDAGHQARLPYPSDAQQLFVLLDGDYLYVTDLTVLDAASAPDTIVLEPVLGARIHGRCVLPRGVERRDVDPRKVEGEVELYGLEPTRRSKGEPRMFHRQVDLSPTGEFDVRALPANISLAFGVKIDNLLREQQVEAVRLAAGELREVEALFRLGGSIRGRVVDPDGNGVAKATVWSEGSARGAFGRRSGGQRKTTDDQGRFALQGLSAGECRIHAEADGWKETQSEALPLAEDQEIPDLAITLETGSRIAGTVSWPDGSPAPDAELTLYQSEGQRGYRWRNTITNERSAEDGTFAFTGLSEGSYSIEVHALRPSNSDAAEADAPPPMAHLARLEAVAAGTESLAIELEKTLAVSGRVLDDLGQPIAAFAVTAAPSADGEDEMNQETDASDSFEAPDGRFALGGLYPGEWKLSASADGHHMTAPGVQVLVPQGDQVVEIRLERSASVSGIVQDPRGTPVPGAQVGPSQGGSEQSTFFRGGRDEDGAVVSDADGRFVLENLPPGVFAVEASATDWAVSEAVTVELAPGAAVEGVIVALRNGGRIVGDVFDESGEPMVGRQVTLGMAFWAMGMGGSEGETTDAAGHFVFTHVDPGRYAVTLAPPQEDVLKLVNGMNGAGDEAAMIDMMSNVITENVTVVEGQDSFVRLGAEPKVPVHVHGDVIEAGEPVESGMVFAITEGHALLQGMKMSKIEEGHYEFTVDRPGAYTFGVQSDEGDAPLEFQVDVPKVESFEHDLVLPRGAIAGRVYGPDGDPAPFAEVHLSREDSGFSLSLDTEGRSADADGRYVATHLRPGIYTVRAGGGSRFGGGADDPFGVEIVTGVRVEEDRTVDGIDLHLRSSGSIEGTVTDRSDKPVGGVAIYVRDERGLLLASVSPATSEPNGHFLYKGVAPGRFTVSARGQGLAACDGPVVDVRKGEVSEVELQVDAATMLNVTVEDEQGESIRASIQVIDERGHEVAAMYSQTGMESMMMEGLDSKKTRVGPLPAGKYEVYATDKEGRTSSKPVNLSGKDERNLRIKIRD